MRSGRNPERNPSSGELLLQMILRPVHLTCTRVLLMIIGCVWVSAAADGIQTPAEPALASDVSAQVPEMKRLVTEQQKELTELRQSLLDQKREIEALKRVQRIVSEPSAGSEALTSNGEQSTSAVGERSDRDAMASAVTAVAEAPVPTVLRDRLRGSGEVASLRPIIPQSLAPSLLQRELPPVPAPNPKSVSHHCRYQSETRR